MALRVRFAPSPTGFVHIGSLRTALYNYLLAKRQGGQYILRIEDTDQSRMVEGSIEDLLRSMEWARIKHDEGVIFQDNELTEIGEYGPYIQSERLDIYQEYIKTLLAKGDAYYCFCSRERLDELRKEQRSQGLTAKYDGYCRDLSHEEVKERIKAGEAYVIRLKLPQNRDIEFEDIVRGKVVVNTDEIDDQVLIKSDGFPTYHFAVVVDDHLMKITHIIRGEEWLPSTPKHAYLYEVFGWEAPKFVHLPNILNTEKKKLSKRHGDVAVEDFMKKGYLPEALVNYIALIGWSPEENKEILTMEELEKEFSLERVSKSSGVFDVNKLNWMNNHYIKESSLDKITDLAIPYLIEAGYIEEEEVDDRYEWLKAMISVVKDSIDHMSQVVDKVDIFFKSSIEPENDKANTILQQDFVGKLLRVFHGKVSKAEDVEVETIKAIFKEIQKEEGIRGPNLFRPIRVAVTGQAQGPDLPLIIKVLGRQKLLNRVEYVLNNFIK